MEEIICRTSDGERLKTLYQWDSNQTIGIEGIPTSPLPEVHFWACRYSRALVCETSVEDDMVKVAIPNALLQEPEMITAFVYTPTGEDGARTSHVFQIPVRARPKPEDYAYEDDTIPTVRIPAAPDSDGTYILRATVSGGTATYAWVPEL